MNKARSGGGAAATIGVGIVGVATLTAVLLNPLSTSPAAADELTAFDDCAALARHMSNLAVDRLESARDAFTRDKEEPPIAMPMMADGDFATDDVAVEEAMPLSGSFAGEDESATDAAAAPAPGVAADVAEQRAAVGGDPGDAVASNSSGTNVQEAGVDEADLAKTDGKLLLTVTDGELIIVDVSGTRPRTRGAVELPGQTAQELLLAGDRAVVLGAPTDDAENRDFPRRGGTNWTQLTSVSVVDLSDPDEPEIIASEQLGARYLSTRMVGDTVRIVLSSTPTVLGSLDAGFGFDDYSYYGKRMPDEDRRAVNDYIAEVRERLAAVPGEDWLPTRRMVDREARTVTEEPLLDCADVRYPATDSGMDLLTILSLDIDANDPLAGVGASAVIASGDLVYATTDRLFVATTEGGWNDPFSVARTGSTMFTRVHSFDISGADAQYLATGRVPGYLYGRWAMSEHEGLLRMVTTTAPPWNGRSTQTGVVILDTAGDQLREIGRVDGMGFTETVRSVRWFDDMAAIVTFRQTDPLYLVDVSRPQTPRVRGELKIPGYSSYLHPIGDDRLLGVGQDANEWGGTLGLQVSSFDVLDLADPRRDDALFFGRGTSSPVETDARGFVYLPESRRLMLPVNDPGYGGGFCPPNAACLAVDEPATRPGVPTPDLIEPGFAPEPYPQRSPSARLVAVRVDTDGDLREAADWESPRSGWILKVIPLPGDRLAVLDGAGVTLLDADDLDELGYARYR